MINNILVVCIGNICRSPMAEGLVKQMMPQQEVYSAGLNALIGEPADRWSILLMREHGIDISAHRARRLGAWMVSDADLILTMDQYQKDIVEMKYPASRNKVFRLGEFGNYDIPDPYHQGLGAFRESYNLIAQGVDELGGRLAHIGKDRSRYDMSIIQHSPQTILGGERQG